MNENKSLILSCKRFTLLKIKKVQTVEDYKLEKIVRIIEEAFALITKLDLENFCYHLWLKIVELKLHYQQEFLLAFDLRVALDELLYLTKYLLKGGDNRGCIQ